MLEFKVIFFSTSTILLFYEVWLYFKLRRMKMKDDILYAFCDFRRKLMHLVVEDKLDPRNIVFRYFYKLSSEIIHYPHEYDFSIKMLIKLIGENKDNLKTDNKFYDKIMKELDSQDDSVTRVVHLFFVCLVKAFMKNSASIRLIYRVSSVYGAIKKVGKYLLEETKRGRLTRQILFLPPVKNYEEKLELFDSVQKWEKALAV